MAQPDKRQLLQQVAWFNRLRFVAVAGMVVFTAISVQVFGLQDDPHPLYGLAGLTLLLNLFYLARFGKLSRLAHRRVRRHVDLQIGLDLLVLTALLHYSGGIASPLVLFYLFHTFIAALVLGMRAGLTVAALSIFLVGGQGLCELEGWIPSRPTELRLLDLQEAGTRGLVAWLLAFGLTMCISAYFLSTVLRQVRRQDKELRRLNVQLGQSEKLASIGTLAAGVAHEINNPVGVIRNKVEILRYRIQDGDDQEPLLQELTTIERHTQRIAAITKGLLTFSKETPFILQPVDLNRLAREGAELVRVPFKEAGVDLQLDLDAQPLEVRGSDNHLLQVMVNLLLNARDASRDAPGAGDQRAVTLRTVLDGDMAVLSVLDQGAGIRPEDLGKIFDPFFTTKDVDRGTGLGLTISHGIVEKHQGRFEVTSTLGQGSVFQVYLPLSSNS